eukprot:scaffold20825_cov64-Phaeocystis_antarctica.AAC.5
MAAAAEVTAERRVLRPSMRRVSPDEMQKAAMSVLYSIFAWVRVEVGSRDPVTTWPLVAKRPYWSTTLTCISSCNRAATSATFQPARVSRGFHHQARGIETRGGHERGRTAAPSERQHHRSSKCTRPISPPREAGGRWDGCLGWGWLHTTTRVR